MKRIDSRLISTAEAIDRQLSRINKDNRSEISTDLLPHIRNFCEVFMYKVYDEEKNVDLYQTQENLIKVRQYIRNQYPDIDKFHESLNSSVGHMDFGPLQSEALTIRYIPKLIIIKGFLFDRYGIGVLKNINKYPLDLDKSLASFYEKILSVLLHSQCDDSKMTRNLFFVRKRSLKYINGTIFYEYVLDVSDDKANRFNTFVCYSLKNIYFDYDLKLLLSRKQITFLNTKIYINVIYDYEYSIRPCAFKNLLYLINKDFLCSERNDEYKSLMALIKNKSTSLVDIIDGDEELVSSNKGHYFNAISYIKEYVRDKKPGTNLIRYLLLEMRNNVINAQRYKPYGDMPSYNEKFNNIRIRLGSKPFELMPFAFFPKESKPTLHTLAELFDASKAKEEILYRQIVDYINQNNTLFVKPSDIGYSEEVFNELKERFNQKLLEKNPYFSNYKIVELKGYYSIEEYYRMTVRVIKATLSLCDKQNKEINNDYAKNLVLSPEQKDILSKSFVDSSISLITGAAGTGKTTLIKEFIKNNADKRILCLTTTNTAVCNLKIKGLGGSVSYRNISQFKNEGFHELFDIVIIDEASFVDTKSIDKILSFYRDSSFLIVGDPEQIESIDFGNWFELLLSLLYEKGVVHTLKERHRTDVEEIAKVWNEVRTGKKKNVLELLNAFQMSEKITDNIFKVGQNEIVLCLNYDGLYGINNINRYLQSSNPNKEYEYQQNLYKVGDPIVFIVNDYSRFGIHNNLKGKIVGINDEDEKITFKIQLFDKMDCLALTSSEIRITEENGVDYAIVEKEKFYDDKYNNDMNMRTKLPFQISYAMSIHKAQGLEFDSVKIVITKEADEFITKNIFYTAVTRAKKNLKIYWEPEVANYVLDKIENTVNSKGMDLSILNELMEEEGKSLM